MREILFRGRRQYDYNWSESACPLGEMHMGVVTHDYFPESVGQYIGLTDKRGNKIFEGDIVRIPSFKPQNMKVAFIEGAFCLANACGEYAVDIHYIQPGGKVEAEIIGNIFDDPELLEC